MKETASFPMDWIHDAPWLLVFFAETDGKDIKN